MKGLIIIASIVFAGCAPVVTLPTTVKIPVPVSCPAPPATIRPVLAISRLSPGSSPDHYVRAVESSIVALIGYAEGLEKLLNAYREAR
jgi:hypothetical protein